ncbi:MAG: c-type cytochrome [Limisphaerales bacterium]
MRNAKLVIIASAALLVSSLCSHAADATANWTKHCGSCHGKDGKAQTKAGKMAQTKDLTDAAYQASFTDEEANKRIKEGLKDKNGKDRMKPFAAKLTDEEIKALVTYTRFFKK